MGRRLDPHEIHHDRGGIIGLLLFSVDGQQTAVRGGIYFAPNPARRVTLARFGTLLATIDIPDRTFLSVSYDGQQPASIATGRWEFHGNFGLRALPASEAASRPPGERVFDQTMSRAPGHNG